MKLRRTKFISLHLKVYSLISAFLVFSLSTALALTPEVQKLVTNETKANAVAERSNLKVKIQNFEIPLRLVGKDISDRIPANVRDSLIFEKDGELYVRWIINPEDTKWFHEAVNFLTENGVKPNVHEYFDGYQTASRSYIVESPETGAQFSLKVSTNKTGGHWTNKKQEATDAFDVRRSTDHVIHQGEVKPFQNFKVMDEPAAFGIKSIDQGMIVRTLARLPESDHHYVPGFSIMHEDVGREIAKLNGSMNPAEFWNENYNKPLARALAELAARTGVAFDSPHSQNFLVELDKNMKPTGQIVLRDLGDIYVSRDILEALGNKALADSWPADHIIKAEMPAGVGIMHGNDFPSWLTEAQYAKWGKEYYNVYDREFAKQAGVPEKEITKDFVQAGRYFVKNINLTSDAMKQYLARLNQNVAQIPKRADPYTTIYKLAKASAAKNAPSKKPDCNAIFLGLGKDGVLH